MPRPWLALLACLVPTLAVAQDAEEDGAVAELAKELGALEKRLDKLESRPTGSGDAEADYSELAARIELIQEQLEVLMADDDVTHGPGDVSPSLASRFHGYAEVGFNALSVGEDTELGVHAAGLVLGWTADLGHHAHLDSAVVFGLNESSVPVVEIDRFSIAVSYSRALNVRAGKIYSPFGYWNTNLPHGSFELPSGSRPAVLEFEREGAAFATRQGGVDLFGELTFGMMRMGYHLGVGNGRNPSLTHTQDMFDTSVAKATWAQLWLRLPTGLEFGVTGAYDPIRVSEDAHEASGPMLKQDVDEILVAGHVAWTTQRMQFMAEYFLIGHDASEGSLDNEWLSGDLVYSRSGYLQWSRRFTSITPYFRADYHEKAYNDLFYYDLEEQYAQLAGTLGVRKDISVHSAFSAEFIGGKRVLYTYPEAEEATLLGGGIYLQAAF